MATIAPLLAALLAFADETAPVDPQHVVGGQEVGTCDFPSSVFIGSGGGFNCTASLVHPRVIITAAHCLGNISQAGFGETAFSPATTVPVSNCRAHPSYFGSGLDLGYCVLAQDAPPIPMVPVIMGCEVDEIVPGGQVALAGFGQNNEAQGSGGGIKRWTTNSVDQLSLAANELYLLGNANGSCYGDSGGPAFVQLSDGTWRVAAAVSGPHPNAPPLGCGYGGTYELIHTSMEWIESESGFDVTPCFDADGTWNPDLRCTEFPTELQGAGTTWGNACSPMPVSGPGQTCGAPHPELEEPEPPDDTGGSDDGGAETGVADDGGVDVGDEVGEESDGGSAQDAGGGEDTGALDDAAAESDEGGLDSAGALPPAYGVGGAQAGCSVAPRTPAPGGLGWLGALAWLFVGRGRRQR